MRTHVLHAFAHGRLQAHLHLAVACTVLAHRQLRYTLTIMAVFAILYPYFSFVKAVIIVGDVTTVALVTVSSIITTVMTMKLLFLTLSQ